MITRKLIPISDFDHLAPGELAEFHAHLDKHYLKDTRCFVLVRFYIDISYKRLWKYYHRRQESLLLTAGLGREITPTEYTRILNGEGTVIAEVAMHRIQTNVCKLAFQPNHTPTSLERLQRVVNSAFHRDHVRHIQTMDAKKHDLRERELGLRREIAEYNRAATSPPLHVPRQHPPCISIVKAAEDFAGLSHDRNIGDMSS